jgi:predicted phage tail component-like protein
MATWYITDGDLPFLEEFPQLYLIDDAPNSLWKIIDGDLPFKSSFPQMHTIDDAPSVLWKIIDGDLPFKSLFPKMYKIEKDEAKSLRSSFTFKEINSAEFGIVEILPLCLKHEERTDFINFVSGSPLVRETTALRSKVITVTLGLKDTSPENIDKINSWLIGTGKLILSNDPDRYYIATCNGALTGERLLSLGKLPVQFNVMPYKYDDLESDDFENVTIAEELISKTALIEYEGNAPSESVYKITGTGTIEIYNVQNGNTVEIHDVSGYCIIDIKAKKVYDHNGNVILDHTYGNIFDLQLNKGNNFFLLSTNVTKFEVKKRTRWY